MPALSDSIEHVSLMNDENINSMIKKGTYLVPTMYTVDGMDFSKLKPEMNALLEKEMPEYEKSLRNSIKRGVKIAFGSDTARSNMGKMSKNSQALLNME